MNTMKCTNEWLKAMVAMPSSSKEQNEALAYAIEHKEIALDHCLIKVRDEQVVSRIVMVEELDFLAYFTIEDLTQQECDEFMADVLAQLDRTKEWRIDLYSDKIHHEMIYETIKKYFSIEISRESYVGMASPQMLEGYEFQSACSLDQEVLLRLMMKASASTLDAMQQREQRSDIRAAVAHMRENLMADEESDALFQVLMIDHKPVGFVAINRLLDTIGGIGYLGVDAAYQGHHYGSILLKKALDMAYHHQIAKIIGDIDVHNTPIRRNLQACGFQLDCTQRVFFLEAVNKTVDKSEKIE